MSGMKVRLEAGRKIRDEWRVVRKLGSGCFGEVYEVRQERAGEAGVRAAAKLEGREAGEESLLCLEVKVLRRFSRASHAPQFLACGSEEGFYWMVMELLGPSLHQLKRQARARCFSLSTGLRMLRQGLEALYQFHTVSGFVHRDLKPANLVLGHPESPLPARARILVLIDYGLARRFTKKDWKGVRRPRSNTAFRGSTRYASLAAHHGLEVGRADDLYSLLYVVLDLLGARLPWSGITNRSEAARRKEDTSAKRLVAGFPPGLAEYPRLVAGLPFAREPPYPALDALLTRLCQAHNIRDSDNFDWETGSFFSAILRSIRTSNTHSLTPTN